MGTSGTVCALYILLAAISHLEASSSGSLLPQEVYWNTLLPKSPMPSVLHHLLHSDVNNPFNLKGLPISPHIGIILKTPGVLIPGDPNYADYILYKDLQPGINMTLHVLRTTARAGFLPRHEADRMPFSTSDFPKIATTFSILPNTLEDKTARATVRACTQPFPNDKIMRLCATSVESMMEFAVTRLGTFSVRAASSKAIDMVSNKVQPYTITNVLKVEGDKGVLCHPLTYPYALYYCHVTHDTEMFVVGGVAEDGTVVEAVAACHMETSQWTPKHLAFLVLNEKPGVPVCHFLPMDNVMWTTEEGISAEVDGDETN